jgi:hypothetical protein
MHAYVPQADPGEVLAVFLTGAELARVPVKAEALCSGCLDTKETV